MGTNISKYINLKDVKCPMNFVKTKLALEDMGSGEYLELVLDEGDPLLNVPRSLKDDGHKVVKVTNNNDGTYTIIVEKGQNNA